MCFSRFLVSQLILELGSLMARKLTLTFLSSALRGRAAKVVLASPRSTQITLSLTMLTAGSQARNGFNRTFYISSAKFFLSRTPPFVGTRHLWQSSKLRGIASIKGTYILNLKPHPRQTLLPQSDDELIYTPSYPPVIPTPQHKL